MVVEDLLLLQEQSTCIHLSMASLGEVRQVSCCFPGSCKSIMESGEEGEDGVVLQRSGPSSQTSDIAP
jgi:hypothetical protein